MNPNEPIIMSSAAVAPHHRAAWTEDVCPGPDSCSSVLHPPQKHTVSLSHTYQCTPHTFTTRGLGVGLGLELCQGLLQKPYATLDQRVCGIAENITAIPIQKGQMIVRLQTTKKWHSAVLANSSTEIRSSQSHNPCYAGFWCSSYYQISKWAPQTSLINPDQM